MKEYLKKLKSNKFVIAALIVLYCVFIFSASRKVSELWLDSQIREIVKEECLIKGND